MGKLISLDRLCGGAVLERFTMEMAKVGRNIMDPNTNPEKARTLTIKLTFKPDKGRKGIKTSVTTSSTLAPQESDETMLLIGQDIRTGRIEMSEYGDNSQEISMAGESIPVKTEVVPTAPPARSFNPNTGEIYEPSSQETQPPIDLRQAI